jgi:hypothetical protein
MRSIWQSVAMRWKEPKESEMLFLERPRRFFFFCCLRFVLCFTRFDQADQLAAEAAREREALERERR